jgi:hypothetical protein
MSQAILIRKNGGVCGWRALFFETQKAAEKASKEESAGGWEERLVCRLTAMSKSNKTTFVSAFPRLRIFEVIISIVT